MEADSLRFATWDEAFDAVIALQQEMWATYDPLATDSPPPPRKDFEARAEREREIAVADYTCRLDVESSARLTTLVQAAEQRFVAEHRTELDAMVEWFAVNPG